MADFTPTQGRYLAFIRAYTNLHGFPPAESEIAAAICVSPPSVNQMVKALEKKGLILRQPGQPRSLQVLVPEDEIPPWNGRKQARSPLRSPSTAIDSRTVRHANEKTETQTNHRRKARAARTKEEVHDDLH